jgi:hypothetical protein
MHFGRRLGVLGSVMLALLFVLALVILQSHHTRVPRREPCVPIETSYPGAFTVVLCGRPIGPALTDRSTDQSPYR